MPQQQSKGARWFPTVDQLKDPAATEQAFRQVLTQLYALTDRLAQVEGGKPAASTGPPAGSGPADTMLLGLRVAPVDSSTLTNGATLQFDKAAGNFKFA